jgi:hypothetical protein
MRVSCNREEALCDGVYNSIGYLDAGAPDSDVIPNIIQIRLELRSSFMSR